MSLLVLCVAYLCDTGPPIISMNTNMISNITSTSFVVLLDEVDDADWFNVLWWEDGGSARENITTQTSITIRGLTPNTKYYVNITAGNICGSVINNDTLSVTTLMIESPVSILTVMTTATTMANSLAVFRSTIYTPPTPTGNRITLHIILHVCISFTIIKLFLVHMTYGMYSVCIKSDDLWLVVTPIDDCVVHHNSSQVNSTILIKACLCMCIHISSQLCTCI